MAKKNTSARSGTSSRPKRRRLSKFLLTAREEIEFFCLPYPSLYLVFPISYIPYVARKK